MSKLQKITALVLLVLLAVTGYGLWWTTDPAGRTPVRAIKLASPPAQASDGSAIPVIDRNTLLIAQRLARLAYTAEEQPLAQAAVQTADHELDLAFTGALWHLEAHPPPLSPEAGQIQDRLLEAQKAAASDADTVKQLTAQLAKAADADKAAIEDRLELAQSRLELSQDEVQQLNDDLLQAGGNVHQRVQIMQQEHQAAQRNNNQTGTPSPATPLSSLHGMVGQIRNWLSLHSKLRWLAGAQEQASASAEQLAVERHQIASDLAASKAQVSGLGASGERAAASPAGAAPATVAAPARGATPGSLLGVTRQLAAEQHRLTLRDQRIAARRKLADIYGQWQTVVTSQAHAALHACLVGAAVVLAALLLLLFADRWLERLLGRLPIDRRQLATLRSVIGVALQIVGVTIILLMLVGLPGQLGTMLGIIGAGLTVALKDFIVAFIGWFVLMGRNGIRVGDWVEINGVSGEVVEINMFHTVLLETGNWTDAGHPTGRRVTFTNSFAISGHYFNFSTTGQWLWDELSVMVPYGRDPHKVADAIQKEVTEATAKDAAQAEHEWRRASRGQRGVGFTAQPGIAVRPATGGVEVAVRYVTRASERLALRARLYQSAVQLLAAHA
ncbi:MAG TPA: mechanosensitive ion channel domain-containing protein [Steroidobacteraceae bacterium]|nr:mechanosensitive ion channel domain-containing protein [Steroidobacteraceae bacterium]